MIKSIPGPFAIAAGLTMVTLLMAFVFTRPDDAHSVVYGREILGFWYGGFWGLLDFAMQMMLILVLGHVLAYTAFVKRIIDSLMVLCSDNASAAFYITLFTIIAALFNWGLGLIFGAIMARKVAEHAEKKGIAVNYPLLGAAGYSGLMVWHCGLSGSAPLTVAGSGHFLEAETGIISVQHTLFSTMNLTVVAMLIVTLPLFMYWVGKRTSTSVPVLRKQQEKITENTVKSAKLNKYAIFFGGLMLLTALLEGISRGIDPETSPWEVLSLNYINFLLLGLCLLLSGSFEVFSKATSDAIVSGTGIFLQFPLYAGIMGVMAESGLLAMFSGFFVEIATADTFPIFTFISAAIVNVFVPSGGGQWAVQGPVIYEASNVLNLDFAKSVMALSYGDQITNMIQPFWALPLLGITGLKAGELLPFTLRLMGIGIVIYVSALILF